MADVADRARAFMAHRLVRDLEVAAIGMLCALSFYQIVLYMPEIGWRPGFDFDIYHAAASRFVSGDSYFLPHQLSGPYELGTADVLYPPVALWLFVPFVVLPAQLWWLIPGAITAAAIWRLRPSLTAWLVVAILMERPFSLLQIVNGNPSMWVVAILFATAAWRVPSTLILFKPTLLPLAFFRPGGRWWWLGIAALALLSVPFAGLTLTWVEVVLNARGSLGLAYSLHELTFVVVPLVAYLGRDRTRDRQPPSGGQARARLIGGDLRPSLRPAPAPGRPSRTPPGHDQAARSSVRP